MTVDICIYKYWKHTNIWSHHSIKFYFVELQLFDRILLLDSDKMIRQPF